MKFKRRIFLIMLLSIGLLIGLCAIRVNPYTPIGAIRCECLLHGHIYSAIFLRVEDVTEIDKIENKYKIIYAVPYEKETDTHLDYWNVKKNKNGTYSASYGVA